jgi:N-acetylglucosamine-6-phosphate deacetylase
MQYFGRRFDTGQPVCLEVSAGKIARQIPVEVDRSVCQSWPWVSPSLLDIQVNGYGGQEFSNLGLTPDKVAEIGRSLETFGVTRYCPTVTTQHFQVLAHALKTIASACESQAASARQIAGVHLEGPYLSAEDGPRGAHPREHCRRPDWEEFQRLQEAAGGRIRLLTMSVEFDESAQFIAKVVGTGVVVAIGHTAADSIHIRQAVDAGARLSTHLGNGAHGTLRRHPNYLWDQLAEDRLMASLIVDGHHLPPEVVQTFVRAKTPERCILISDMSGLAGLPPGRYTSNLCDLEILPNGRLVIAGQSQLLAGASLPLSAGVANVIQFAGVDLATAIDMATVHPAELLGLRADRLDVGTPACLMQFSVRPGTAEQGSRLTVFSTVSSGEIVFGSPWRP